MSENHALEQAKAQARSVVKMVRALERETAAEDFLDSMTDYEVNAFLVENDCVVQLFETIREAALDLITARHPTEPVGFEFDEDSARERIQEDALSVEVRSDWTTLGEELKAEEFCITLCTGGPAVRIVGELDNGEPSRAWIEYQDWGTPWTQLFNEIEQDTLLTYCRQFYFGE